MNDTLHIRKIEDADTEQILTLYMQTFTIAFAGYLPPKDLNDSQIKEKLCRELKNKLQKHVGFVAYDDTCPYLGFVVLSPIADDETSIELDKLYISPQAQGKGVGKFLLQFVQDYVRTKKISQIIIWTLENGPGRPFYEHCGAKTTGQKACWVGNSSIIQLVLKTY